ncbi:MAG: hypothetical protein ACOX9C_11425 [Kiritimatiellia bacterium]|jgi:hypothetical protein
MTFQTRILIAVAMATLMLAGCKTAPKEKESTAPKTVASDKMLTALETTYNYMTPRDLKESGGLRIALVDVDFSRPNLAYDFNVVSFTPDGTDALLAVATEPAKRLNTLSELRDYFLAYMPSARIGVVMMFDGEPLGTSGKSPQSAHNAFFREFAAMMDAAGIDYTYIVPDKITIIN